MSQPSDSILKSSAEMQAQAAMAAIAQQRDYAQQQAVALAVQLSAAHETLGQMRAELAALRGDPANQTMGSVP